MKVPFLPLEIRWKKPEQKPPKKLDEKRLNKSWIFLSGTIIIALGIIIILVSFLLKPRIPETYSEVVASTCITLGQIAISIGVTAMLFEHSGFADYAVRRMCDVLLRNETLHSLNMNRKQELKNLLFKNIYLGNQQTDDSLTLLDQLDKDTNKLLSDYYYEEYITYCDMSLVETEDGRTLLHKNMRRIFTAKPIQDGKICNLERLYYVRISGPHGTIRDKSGQEIQPLSIPKVVINNKVLTPKKDYSLKYLSSQFDEDPYSSSYELMLKAPEQLTFSRELKVELHYETYVPYNDPYYAVTVDRPCKFFSCTFSKDISNYDLTVKSYGFMSYGNSQRKHQIKTQNSIVVRFRSWILPGDGALAILSPQ